MTNQEFLERENRKLRILVDEILNERDTLLNEIDQLRREVDDESYRLPVDDHA